MYASVDRRIEGLLGGMRPLLLVLLAVFASSVVSKSMAWLQAKKAKANATGRQLDDQEGAPTVAAKVRKLERRTTPIGTEAHDVADPSNFHNGTYLANVAQRCVQLAIRKVGRPRRSKRMEIGGACSGSEALAICIAELSAACRSEMATADLNVPFLIEIDEAKREWAGDVHEVLGFDGCRFDDVTKIANSNADPFCSKHSALCQMPKLLDGFVA